VACEVFGIDRTDDGLPAYDFAVVAGEPGTLRSEAGFTLQTDSGLERLRAADLVIVPAHADHRCDRGDWPPALLAALRDVWTGAPGC
jgi:transcriptional regulator GlxA family with amidase domain